MRGIADTGLVVALLNRSDRYHQWAAAVARQISEPLFTCEAVLAEAAFQVGSAALVLALVQDGFLNIAFNLEKNIQEVAELAARYSDRSPDLADLCLVRMSELFPDLHVFTVDESDFRIFRRNKREVIPIICPPRG